MYDDIANAISAVTRGHEAVPFTRAFSAPDTFIGTGAAGAAGTRYGYLTTIQASGMVSVRDAVADGATAKLITGGVIYRITGVTTTTWANGNYIYYTTMQGTTPPAPSAGQAFDIIVEELRGNHTSESPAWTDIIGRPVNIAATAVALGVDGFYGTWMGAPDGSSKVWEHRRELDKGYGTISTTDEGTTFATNVGWDIPNAGNSVTSYASSGQVFFINYKTKAHFTEDDPGVVRKTDWSPITAINSHTAAHLVSSLTGKVSTGTSPTETLAITKIVSGVVSHIAETLTADVKFCCALGEYNGRMYVMFNVDDAGVIDGSNIKVHALPYFWSK